MAACCKIGHHREVQEESVIGGTDTSLLRIVKLASVDEADMLGQVSSTE